MKCQLHSDGRKPRFKIEATPAQGEKIYKLIADTAEALRIYALYARMGYKVLLMPA